MLYFMIFRFEINVSLTKIIFIFHFHKQSPIKEIHDKFLLSSNVQKFLLSMRIFLRILFHLSFIDVSFSLNCSSLTHTISISFFLSSTANIYALVRCQKKLKFYLAVQIKKIWRSGWWNTSKTSCPTLQHWLHTTFSISSSF